MGGRAYTANQAGPARLWFEVVPSDTDELPGGCRALYVGGAGDVSATDAKGNTVVFVAVNPGTTLPIGPLRVNATGTSAASIIALY